MGRVVTAEERQRLFEDIREFLAAEFEVDPAEITEETDVVNDLGGDSVVFLEMVEELREKYGIQVEVRTIGQFMLRRAITNIGQAVDALCEVIEKGEELIAQEEAQAT
ncbi:acyl carrier protein [Desulfosoma sp.]